MRRDSANMRLTEYEPQKKRFSEIAMFSLFVLIDFSMTEKPKRVFIKLNESDYIGLDESQSSLADTDFSVIPVEILGAELRKV